MVKILREADQAPVAEVAKKHGISEVTIYAWRTGALRLHAQLQFLSEFEGRSRAPADSSALLGVARLLRANSRLAASYAARASGVDSTSLSSSRRLRALF